MRHCGEAGIGDRTKDKIQAFSKYSEILKVSILLLCVGNSVDYIDAICQERVPQMDNLKGFESADATWTGQEFGRIDRGACRPPKTSEKASFPLINFTNMQNLCLYAYLGEYQMGAERVLSIGDKCLKELACAFGGYVGSVLACHFQIGILP
mmetsp:Transcript_19339/g.35110  ORF Transcript_19339/g.35110 Transcript_19339/m.35110 type:complete len:152 (-) Transcript_19339:51-506(-)